MKLNNKKALHDFKDSHQDAKGQINSWEAEVDVAKWKTPNELKQRYPKASILKNRNVIFDFCRNKYRLWVTISYQNGIVLVRKIGTHKEYDKWKIE
ncbi:MAG TPA: type II toxin-antitoxin system HigB family toxin [Candidatus Saccharimonadales bacterium]